MTYHQPIESPSVRSVINQRRNRRWLLTRTLAFGMSVPAIGVLLAACGGDDDDEAIPTATSAAAQPTATTAMAEPTATTADAQPMATTVAEDPTATTTTAPDPTATTASALDEILGFTIDPAAHEGGTLIRGVNNLSAGYFLVTYRDCEFVEPLAELHPTTGEPTPLLAERWETSSDGTSWTLVLRPEVTFHDGSSMTAADVVFSMQLINAALWGGEPVRSAAISAVDDLSVDLAFETTAVDVPATLWFYTVKAMAPLDDLDPTTVEADSIMMHPANTGDDLSRFVTTAPFRVVEAVVDDHMTLERYDGYWGGTPHLDQIVMQLFGSIDQYVPAIQSGEIDLAGDEVDYINPAQAGELSGDATAIEVPGIRMTLIGLNHQNPMFVDQSVRQALLYAIDRQAIIDAIMFGYGSVINATLALPWAFDEDTVQPIYDYDPEEAAALLEAAGWVPGADGVREKDGRRFSATGWYTSSDTVLESTAVAVQEYWRAVGVELSLQSEDNSAWGTRWAEGNFDAIFAFGNGNIVDQQIFWRSTPPSHAANRYHYANPDLDALMVAAAVELDVARRRELTTEVLSLVMEDLPVLPLYFRNGLFGIREAVHNVYPSVHNLGFNAETWWVDA